MDEKFKKYLPLGSVVLMKDAKKRVMIIGFAAKGSGAGDRLFDYVGCLYPEGLVSSDKNLLFDHKDIGQIYALGYVDDEWKTVEPKIHELVGKLLNKNSEN